VTSLTDLSTGDSLGPVAFNLAVALGIGLLVGGERERRKAEGSRRQSAGIRTFSIAALLGAVSFLVGGAPFLAVTTAAIAVLAAVGYWRTQQDDPGLTTEVALVLTALLGGLAMQHQGLAGGVAVATAILLAARSMLHRFVRSMLTAGEVRDALILAGAAIVVLPLLPDRAVGPYGALNPHKIWFVVVLVLAISALGHGAVRLLGARYGLPLAGLASGFVSSIATIGAMGTRAKKEPQALDAAVAGAVLSTVATIVQLASVVAVISLPTLEAISIPLFCAGFAAIAYASVFTVRAMRTKVETAPKPGQAFSLSTALVFALTLSVVLVAAAALRDGFGETGATLAGAVAGLVDTHAAAISIAAMAASGKLSAALAVVPILAGFTTNTASKMVIAGTSGGRAFALRVIPGLIFVAGAAWVGAVALSIVR
jgi:uncharacterized membrane protein (DUF4010 family)